ncbi:hypothetical protein CONLIGDRAFT_683294 [Coniochaeta ligniaria NRRL 30616]|uniref:Rhodopsin domain-containing protein n=1 Tax=Coniochaeta ligniaria NRRL 30616 TaxID=1408157 RepID=A0A1J7JFC9_9PEZI|nr:hypothetical protein CONLIGDRAFT_683294 [Coniochaeta ligniaria NRRL 30616]
MDNSTSPSEPTLMPGQSPPLTVITPTDQGGIVVIAAALALIFALVSIVLRLFIRVEFRRRFFGDDAFMIIQTGLIFSAVSHGFGKVGKDVSDSDLVAWEKLSYVSDIFYLLTLWSTKISAALLFIRLSPDKTHNVLSHMFMGLSALLATISIFIICLRCQVAEPWLFVGIQCPGLFARWQTLASFDISSEVLLFLIAIYIVQGLQLALRKKMVVVFAFGLRLPIIAAAAIHLHYQGIAIGSADPSLDGVLPTVCAEIELCYAVIATTIPCLRPFVFALSTNYGGPKDTRTLTGNASKPGHDISMGSLSTSSKAGKAGNENQAVPATRWDGTGYNVDVVRGDHESMLSNDSKRMIINKNTEWIVDHEVRAKDI